MAVVAITGGPGAPGATSAALALLLSWPLTEHRRVLLVEADPDGGAVLAGALQGEVQADKGLRNLAVSDRRGRLLQEMWDQCIDLSPQGTGDRLLLPGLTDPAQAAALVYTWEPLAEACRTLDGYGCDVIVDLGRSGGHGPSAVLARRADAVLAVLRTTLRGLSSARPRVAALAAELAHQGMGDALALLLIREGPYAAAEISRALGAPVIGLLPFAPKEARVLSDGGGLTTDRRFQRSELMRAARSTGDELRALTARRLLVARPAGTPQPAADLPSIPPPAQGAAPDLHAVPAPAPVPLRVVPTPPPPAPIPVTPAADATRLGYRQAHAPSVPTPEPPAAPSPLAHPPRPAPVPQPAWAAEPQPPAAADPATAAHSWPVHDSPRPAAATGDAVAGRWPSSAPAVATADSPAGRWSTASQAPRPASVGEPQPPVAPDAAAAGSWLYRDSQPAAPAGPRPAPADWPVHDSPRPAAATGSATAGRWSTHASAPRPAWVSEAQPPGAVADPAGGPGRAHGAASGVGSGTGVGPRVAGQGGEAWSVREVLDLAAAAELGAPGPVASGPAQSPIGPVTPGQAARLQSVHLESAGPAQAPVEETGSPFNPPNMVAMPPLAEHAPRPPAPGEFRPADDGDHGDGNGPAGEVARVR